MTTTDPFAGAAPPGEGLTACSPVTEDELRTALAQA